MRRREHPRSVMEDAPMVIAVLQLDIIWTAGLEKLMAERGLLDNTLMFLTKGDKTSGKVLDNLKRFEIGLRGFMPRLEVIHRELPFRYEEYVRKLIAYVRNARTKALDPLFSDTVIKKGEN